AASDPASSPLTAQRRSRRLRNRVLSGVGCFFQRWKPGGGAHDRPSVGFRLLVIKPMLTRAQRTMFASQPKFRSAAMANTLSAQTTAVTEESRETANPLSTEELSKIDRYWRAANYLSVGQIYLRDNALMREPLVVAHTKPRLLGHWGTTPGLNFVYAHMNRVIKKNDLNAIFITGP